MLLSAVCMTGVPQLVSISDKGNSNETFLCTNITSIGFFFFVCFFFFLICIGHSNMKESLILSTEYSLLGCFEQEF